MTGRHSKAGDSFQKNTDGSTCALQRLLRWPRDGWICAVERYVLAAMPEGQQFAFPKGIRRHVTIDFDIHHVAAIGQGQLQSRLRFGRPMRLERQYSVVVSQSGEAVGKNHPCTTH